MILLYDNPTSKHTWLIIVCPIALYSWVLRLLAQYGASLEILPVPILKLYDSWVHIYSLIPYMNE